MVTIDQNPCELLQNQLLVALPQKDMDRWQCRLELVDLSLNQIIYVAGGAPEYVYFPTTAIVSLISRTVDGATVEVALVGNDGVVGISLLLGADAVATDAVVQSAGSAYRISARFVKAEMEASCDVMKVVMRYAQAVLGQMAQTAICNRYHSIDQQLCRRLLLGLDRLPSDELDMTHELAANLLGVRREGVTLAALKLQQAGLIRYSRGHIVVLDRESLEQMACECYAIGNKEYRRLMSVGIAA
ncbi:MAG: Crp/Fnr family transcriptional regulator [Limnobacter sp.]|nr:Crp/Fnr family transcriptional regulator [Limnobacter sp.]